MTSQGNHVDDIYYYFLSWVHNSLGTTMWAWLCCLYRLVDNKPLFDNPDFIKSFSQSFMNVVLSLDPNKKFDPTNPTPAWNHWSSNYTEMLFNKTSLDEPDIKMVQTTGGLVEQCGYVCPFICYWYYTLYTKTPHCRFWHSVAASIGQ